MIKKTSLSIAFALAVFALGHCAAGGPLKSERSGTPVFTNASGVKWFSPMKGAPIKFGTAFGNTFKGEHGTFGTFPGGFKTPWHKHSHGYHGVVVEGTVTNPMKGDGSPAKKMGPGSYWFVPANAIHATACVSKKACKFYMHQSVNFDFTMAK